MSSKAGLLCVVPYHRLLLMLQYTTLVSTGFVTGFILIQENCCGVITGKREPGLETNIFFLIWVSLE